MRRTTLSVAFSTMLLGVMFAAGCNGCNGPAKKKIAQQLKFTGPVLADIYLQKIKKWNDPAIQKLNPDVKLPDLDILVVHRSDGSGTTYIWVDYFSKVSPAWKDKVGGAATSVSWPTGQGEKGNEGVAGQVGRTPGSIGYVELIYAMQNKIEYGSVQNKEGQFVSASLESVTAAGNASLTDIPDDLRYSITDAAGKESYPISGSVWGVAYTKSGKGKAVREFLHWCTHDGQQFAEALHYSRIPDGLVKRLEKKLELIDGGKEKEEKRLTGAGSTFVFPMMSKWGSEYEKAKGVKINYVSIGSGGGIQQMTAQTVDFGCSDGPMNPEQLKKAMEVNGEVVHIPLVMGGVVPIYNVYEGN